MPIQGGQVLIPLSSRTEEGLARPPARALKKFCCQLSLRWAPGCEAHRRPTGPGQWWWSWCRSCAPRLPPRAASTLWDALHLQEWLHHPTLHHTTSWCHCPHHNPYRWAANMPCSDDPLRPWRTFPSSALAGGVGGGFWHPFSVAVPQLCLHKHIKLTCLPALCKSFGDPRSPLTCSAMATRTLFLPTFSATQ